MYPLFQKPLKISSHIERRLTGTKVGLRASRPACMGKNTAVCTLTGKVIVIAFRSFIEIPVLVMDTEKIAELLHRLRKLSHPFPSAGLCTGRAYIRMLIVIACIAPSVKVEIEFLNSVRLEGLHLFRSFLKRNHTIVLIRSSLIKKFRIRLHTGLDSLMDKGSTDKLFHGGSRNFLFLQGLQLSFLSRKSSILL